MLTEKNQWLQERINDLKESRPDVLLDNLEKRLRSANDELVRLNEDKEHNIVSIAEKEREIENLFSDIEDLKARIDECPHCGAELVRLGSDLDEGDETKSYGCGYTTGNHTYPCPFDPNFPKLDEYDLKMRYVEKTETWYCVPKPKTKNAGILVLGAWWGKTEGQAKNRVIAEYKFAARNVPK